jgi:broad specificity phosphatase PhoE
VEVDERWIELDYGELDGRPVGEVPPATWAAWRADAAWRPPGGESLADLGARVRAACDLLVDAAREHDVVVVSHVSPIKAAVAWALGVGDEAAWRMWVGPASITRIGVSGPVPSLRTFNEVAHLV